MTTQRETATVTAARDDARAQAGRVAGAMPYLPASSTPYPPEGIDPAALTWAETVAPGGYTHKTVARGTRIRLTDVTGEACAHVLLYNADQPWERLNVADTVKIPWQAYLTAGHPLLSGDGRVLATIADDTADGHHDTFCGTSTPAAINAKYGDLSAGAGGGCAPGAGPRSGEQSEAGSAQERGARSEEGREEKNRAGNEEHSGAGNGTESEGQGSKAGSGQASGAGDGGWAVWGGRRSGRELFVLAAAKHDLTPRDLPPSVSFFQGVRVTDDGTTAFTGSAGPGGSVDLLAELPLIVLIANVPHPVDPRPEYTSGPLRVHAWKSRPTGPGDPFWNTTPESHRAYLNTADYATARGIR